MKQRALSSLSTSIAALLLSLIPASSVSAFQLSPQGSFIEIKLSGKTQTFWERFQSRLAEAGVHKIGKPVHEEITNRVLGCEGDADVCSEPQYDPAHAYFLAGVRWNDDPPFRFELGHGNYSGCVLGKTIRLVTFPECWMAVFIDGKDRSSRLELTTGSDATLLLRSHFGDLQFLHAMASRESEIPADSAKRALMWAEFTWLVATGEIGAGDRIADLKIGGMRELFGTKGWDVQDLFALGNPHIRKQEYMKQVAFGSLLHMVQDSFSVSHVLRRQVVNGSKCPAPADAFAAPGKIMEFHTYAGQNSARHGAEDKRDAFSRHWSSGPPTVVDVGKRLYELFLAQARWPTVKPYIDCIFELAPDARRSSAGEEFKK